MSLLGIIVLVVVVAAIVFALFVFLPSVRERTRVKRREHELSQRRKQVITEQRTEADRRERQAEAAEQRARIAEQEAQRERAEAQLRQERAALHERGMADHELVADHEREHFAGTSAVPEGQEIPEGQESGDGAGAQPRTSAYQGERPTTDPSPAEDIREGGTDGQPDEGDGLLDRFRRRSSEEPASRR
jgi:hypothetical protein